MKLIVHLFGDFIVYCLFEILKHVFFRLVNKAMGYTSLKIIIYIIIIVSCVANITIWNTLSICNATIVKFVMNATLTICVADCLSSTTTGNVNDLSEMIDIRNGF